jgi:hypothetical protein
MFLLLLLSSQSYHVIVRLATTSARVSGGSFIVAET